MGELIQDRHAADEKLRYCLSALRGEAYDTLIWVIISDTERAVEELDQEGYIWHSGILEAHYHRFLRKCAGCDPQTVTLGEVVR